MPAILPGPGSFVIEAVSTGSQQPQQEAYVIRMRLDGTYELRSFLSDHGVNEKRIACVIAELGHAKQVTV